MKRKLFTIGGTDVTVHPAAALLLSLGLLSQYRTLMLSTYGCVLLHELAHAGVSALLRHPPREVEITPLGAMMRLEDEERLPLFARLLVIAAGPALTALLCALSLVLTKFGILSRAGGRILLLSNAGILLVNLLPALPLDGGRLLSAVLSRFVRRDTCWRVMRIIGSVLGVALVVFGGVLAVKTGQGNFSLMAAGCFLLYSAIAATTSAAMAELRALMDRKIRIEARGSLPIQPLAMLSTRTMRNAVRALHPTRMTLLYVLEPGTMRCIGVLTEQEVIAAYLTAPQRTLREQKEGSP